MATRAPDTAPTLGNRYAEVEDADGNLVGFHGPRNRDRRR